MKSEGNTWVVVLAAGDGTRLRALTTTTSGEHIPKQFCSVNGGVSLLQAALLRARAVTATNFVCTIVAEQHRRWWKSRLRPVPPANVFVQSRNRGTANGILLPLLEIIDRDPTARVVLLPSDHYVSDELTLATALRRATEEARRHPEELVMLGVCPDDADPELGYIVPGDADPQGLHTVTRFVEKPPIEHARELIRNGALWNAFIVSANARTLLQLFERRCPDVVFAMRSTLRAHRRRLLAGFDADDLYRDLITLDFSRHILEGEETFLRVCRVPACGWSDLGTPERVARALRRIGEQRDTSPAGDLAYLNLAAECQKLGLADTGGLTTPALT